MATCVERSIVYDSHTTDTSSQRLIEEIHQRISGSDKFFSLEFFPPRTPCGAYNLFEKCDRLSQGSPLFCDVASDRHNRHSSHDSNQADDEQPTDIEVASTTQNITQAHTMVHLNSSRMSEESVLRVLDQAKQAGISNIMVMAEDMTQGRQDGDDDDDAVDFSCTADMIRFVRDVFGNHFTICIAGYPEYRSDAHAPREQSFEHLRLQVACGADFIITQVMFRADLFFEFVQQCRQSDIDIPIIPGILPIQSYSCVQQIKRHSSVQIPSKVLNILQPIRNNDEAVLKYGVSLTVDLCKALLSSALCTGLHFFTLNRETATTDVLKRVGLWRTEQVSHRVLPWAQNTEDVREGENVRPIFWACRPGSYQYRTKAWDEFPNGRWGDSSCSSFGSFRDYHLFLASHEESLPDWQSMWGQTLADVSDVCDVFTSFIRRGKNKWGVEVTTIPWVEESLAPETKLICEELVQLNSEGILTINSQPQVNAASSTDKTFGWGKPGGFVFQKAYLEFFCSEEDARNLMRVLSEYEYINYHVVNKSGDTNASNSTDSIAVTWGVFNGSMVLQPTVVDPVAFQYWKDEAFELWMQQWGGLYPAGSLSRRVIQYHVDTFYLVNLVDNDYVAGNRLFEILHRVIEMRRLPEVDFTVKTSYCHQLQAVEPIVAGKETSSLLGLQLRQSDELVDTS